MANRCRCSRPTRSTPSTCPRYSTRSTLPEPTSRTWPSTRSSTRSPSQSPTVLGPHGARAAHVGSATSRQYTRLAFENGDNAWFVEGQLNASYNCVDRHAFKDPNKPAIIYEADERQRGPHRSHMASCCARFPSVACTLKEMGVKKGDTVAHLPAYDPRGCHRLPGLLAYWCCALRHLCWFLVRLAARPYHRCGVQGSHHHGRGQARRQGHRHQEDRRRGPQAVPRRHHCLVYKRTGAEIPWTNGRDRWWHEEVEKYPNYIAPESMNSEDPLFLLYTSGSTGKPKGVMHTTAGYLLGAAIPESTSSISTTMIATSAVVMWVGSPATHTSSTLRCSWVYATVVFEGTPAYPNFSRYWDVIESTRSPSSTLPLPRCVC